MQHYYEHIPGWFFYKRLVDMMLRDAPGAKPGNKPNVLVEVGVWKGRSTAYIGVEMVNSGKSWLHVAVDHFLGSNEEEHLKDPELPMLQDVFKRNVVPLVIQADNPRYELVVWPKSSEDAAQQVGPQTVDYVILDAGHDYQDVHKDLNLWWQRVIPGGVIGGDDWRWPGVQQAVRHFCQRKGAIYTIGDADQYPYWFILR